MNSRRKSDDTARKTEEFRLWSAFRPRYLGLAVFWACSMLTFRSSITLSGAAQTPEVSTIVVLVSFLANITVLLVGSMLLQRNPEQIRRVPWYVFPALIMIGLVLLCFAGHLDDGGSMLAFVITGSIMTGMGYGFFWGSWAQVLGSLKPSVTGVYAIAIYFVSALIFVAVSFAISRLHLPSLPIMELLTILASWCLWKSVNDHDFAAMRVSTDPRRMIASIISLLPLIAVGMVISFFFGFVWEMTVMSMRSADAAHFLPMSANLITAALLIALISLTHRRFEPTRIFMVIIPAVALLFVAFPIAFESHPVLINVAMTVCYGLFDVILWYSIATAAYDFSTSGYVIGGVARSASLIGRLLGICIGYLVMTTMSEESNILVTISAGALYILGVVAVLFLLGRKSRYTITFGKESFIRIARSEAEAGSCENCPAASLSDSALLALAAEASPQQQAGADGIGPDDSPEEATAPAADRPAAEERPLADDEGDGPEEADEGLLDDEAIYESFAAEYGLTRRETEILPYLHRGRSARVIASSLYVAESTVRTHIRHILEKTDQHSKQELIDFMESQQR